MKGTDMTDLLPQIDTTELPADSLLVIEVTEYHIRDGVPGDAASCAIAMAMTELGYCRVGVTSELFWQTSDGYEHWAKLPDQAKSFISRYDEWGEPHHDDDCDREYCDGCYFPEPPAPITFTVEVLDGPHSRD
jgi:hypothetical protein